MYAGQEVEITETSASFYNQRQKVQVTLNKLLEQDEAFGIGMNGEISAVTFGLYAQGGYSRSGWFRYSGRRASGDRFCG